MAHKLVLVVLGWMIGLFTFLCVATPSMTAKEIAWAQNVCENNGGLIRAERWYVAFSQRWAHAECSNGARFGMDKK